MEQPNDLIVRMQQRDEAAFSEIYTRYNQATHGIIYSIVKDQATAEEVLQDVFVKIWENSASYDINKGRFFTWILNIARNSSIDKLRSKSHKNSLKNLSTTNFVDILAGTDNLNNTTDAIGIKNFVDKLKPVCIKIIDLLFFKGYTQKDAAEALDMPLGTIKTRNRNCIASLRTMLIE